MAPALRQSRQEPGEALLRESSSPHRVLDEALLDMIKIDQAELVRSYSLLIPPGAVATLSGEIRGCAFNFEILFEDAPGKESPVVFSARPDGVGVLTFLNWNNPFGMCMSEPMQIGYLRDTNKSKVLLLASNHGIGKANKLDLQLLVQGQL